MLRRVGTALRRFVDFVTALSCCAALRGVCVASRNSLRHSIGSCANCVGFMRLYVDAASCLTLRHSELSLFTGVSVANLRHSTHVRHVNQNMEIEQTASNPGNANTSQT